MEKVKPLQDGEPVMLAAADQWQFLRPGIPDISGNIETTLPQPPERRGRPMPVAPPPQGHDERDRDEQLQQRPAPETRRLPADSKQEVSGLVKGEIEVVEPSVGIRIAEERESITRKEERQAEARPRLEPPRGCRQSGPYGCAGGMWYPGVERDNAVSSSVIPSGIPSNRGDVR